MKKSQNGFVLVSVLLITTISTIYAINEIQGNKLQERIGGNQKKLMNAHMMAEKGVFEAFDYINTGMNGNVSRSVITGLLPSSVSGAQFTISGEDYNSSAVPTYITFISTGEADGATAYLKAKVSVVPGGYDPVFGDAVVGCEGVTLSGSGIIDSFDSTKGDYNQALKNPDNTPMLDEHGNQKYNTGEKGDTKTVVEGADIKLTGASPIHGNVESAGGFDSSGSSYVKGNVSANENVTTTVADSNGVQHAVTQGINAGTDVIVGNNALVSGGIKAKDSFTGNITDGENTLITGGVSTGSYGRERVATESCDNIGITGQVEGYSGHTGHNMGTTEVPVNSWDFSDDRTKNTNSNEMQFTFTDTTGEYIPPGQPSSGPLVPGTYTLDPEVEFLGEPNQTVHVFDEFKLSDHDIVIDGDVKIIVKGDFNALNGSNIKVNKGSKLTMVVLGTITTTDGFRITEVGDPSAAPVVGRSPVEFYSTHSSINNTDYAVNMSGRHLGASVHAALGHVNLNGSAGLKGAIRGKTVTVSGGDGGNASLNTGVHYDENLLKGPPGGDPFPAKIHYVSVADYYY